ncbi:extracellular solute-binding protein [Marinilactibacillus psychrotolerans]|uniref:ABC-type glycerol-3-phosphate transport system, substrate-binding protein n=2 Tax=Lactobacillales TaxID=186826 RepID=A0A1H6RM36_9LACT|nr:MULTISPECIES: extracellular solute-binding protein [Carnobacteriaceae]SEI53607.1 ABC-type glycerol-3-phosphate transport system, substrate-binding protein [Alkalibacterium gilvum]
MKSRRLKRLIGMLSLSAVFTINFTQSYAEEKITNNSEESTETSTLLDQDYQDIVEKPYHKVLNEWDDVSEGDSGFQAVISPSSFKGDKKENLITEDTRGYEKNVWHLGDDDELSFEVDIEESGLYHVGMDYYRLNEGLVDPELSIKVNDEFQYFESRRIIAPTYWENESNDFEENRHGNELVPNQVAIEDWFTMTFKDPNNEFAKGLLFYLEEGTNEITLTHASGEMLIGDIKVFSPEDIITYERYSKNFSDEQTKDELLVQEAEHPDRKNSSYIRPIARKDVNAVPYEVSSQKLNTFGGDSWTKGGQSVTYDITVLKEGLYNITLKTLQDVKQDVPVFRTIEINGDIPFKAFENYRIEPSNDWMNQTLVNEDNEPYSVYLEEGKNTITLTASITPLTPLVNELNEMLQSINTLGLSISRLTGNQPDMNRDWDISEYIPDIKERFTVWIDSLNSYAKNLNTLYGNKEDKTTDEVSLELLIQRLESLRAEPDELPNRLTELSEGSSSATQMVGDLISRLQESPLSLDRFYVHSENSDLPAPKKKFLNRMSNKVKEFVASFTAKTFDVEDTDSDVLEVWVGRNQQYVELMQNMVDANYTAQTGKEVRLSVMPNEQKLILANSSDQQPDVALGVSVGQPWELAIRGAAHNLREFDDFEQFSSKFSPGAFLPMMIDDEVYAMPETQDFYVLFYREDIMEQLDIPIPDTWDDVANILPELQRFGMNFYVPLSGTAGIKPFMFTAPFIYQNGGEIYSENGMQTAIDSQGAVDGMQFMTDLYTLYSLPLQVPNFYNSFRYGELPIGIANFQTYVQLLSAAPEIRNSWTIAPHPGVLKEDGTVDRSAPGSAQGGMIFEKSEKKEEGWDFMKWWMSEDTQVEFATNLQTLFGPEYMWHTANLDAFEELPWQEEHKSVILEQWEYLKEVPKIPGSYMVEREISNAWTDTVFYGQNVRASLDYSVITANREIRRKMEEFNYIEDGEIVEPYRVPQLETVKEWMNQNDEE